MLAGMTRYLAGRMPRCEPHPHTHTAALRSTRPAPDWLPATHPAQPTRTTGMQCYARARTVYKRKPIVHAHVPCLCGDLLSSSHPCLSTLMVRWDTMHRSALPTAAGTTGPSQCCCSAGAISPSMLKHLLKVEGSAAER